MRCVHYLPSLSLQGGGVARVVLDWCTVMARRGLEMTLVSTDRADIPPTWLNPAPGSGARLPRAVVIPPAGGFLRKLGRGAVDTVEELILKTDVLHLHTPWLPGNRQIAAIARGLGIPYVLTPHGMLDDWSTSQRSTKKWVYLRTLGRRCLDGAAMIHCTAAAEAEQASKWFTTPGVAVLPCICDLSPFVSLPGVGIAHRAFPALRRPGLKILFLGRLHEKKGPDLLIRAGAELRRQSVPFVLLLAGPDNSGYRRRLEALVRELGLEDDVVFPGFVGGVERVSLLQSADVLALPTHQENFGLVLTEALACGTPVVTTRGVDIWKEVQSAGGLIVERSAASVAIALRELASDPAAARARGDRGRCWAFDYLDADKLGAAYEALYTKVAFGART